MVAVSLRVCAAVLIGAAVHAQYTGSQACKPCHPSQFSNQSSSSHAKALKPGGSAGVDADWSFGAGVQAITFVSRLNQNLYIEQGRSFYPSIGGLALTPGHRNADGERLRIFDPNAALLRCFQCHSTGPLSLTTDFHIQTLENGVHCETCHGPGAAHVDANGSKAAIRNPGKVGPVELNQLCGQCHRMPAATGDDTNWTNPWNVRHQPLYLAESRCFQQSGTLSCLTCHDPHSSDRPAPATYDARCASCHPKPGHTVALKGQSCVSCHMPDVRPIGPLKFSNHWIGIYSPVDPLVPKGRARSVLPARAGVSTPAH